MTATEYAHKLQTKLSELQRINRPLQLGAYTTVAAISERVFTDGYNSEGQQFQYKSDWYKQYRADRGRETRYVNWILEGDLKSDYENAPKGTNGQGKPVRINANEYESKLQRDINVVKYQGLSERFGEFLLASKEDEKLFYETVEKELALMFEL